MYAIDMLKIKQFRYNADNLGYLLYGRQEALAVDGGAAEAILSFVAQQGLTLRLVGNTHRHADHVSGNRSLLRGSRAEFFSPEDLPAPGEDLLLGEDRIRIIPTPGHTMDSVCFYTGIALISGDTLFNGTIGNCFSGDVEAFYRSVRRLMELPEATTVYAGHDYVRDSMAFARILEPENQEIDAFLKQYDPAHCRSAIADEKRINPYFRFNEPAIVRLLEERDLPRATEWERWHSFMSIE
ncbi:MAG: hydroxyacylglutathione hydrolase [Syntrophaceae bacterium]|nr:hydroxyacylglutathione hydrolase [Syntrophaceae bacterium]